MHKPAVVTTMYSQIALSQRGIIMTDEHKKIEAQQQHISK